VAGQVYQGLGVTSGTQSPLLREVVVGCDNDVTELLLTEEVVKDNVVSVLRTELDKGEIWVVERMDVEEGGVWVVEVVMWVLVEEDGVLGIIVDEIKREDFLLDMLDEEMREVLEGIWDDVLCELDEVGREVEELCVDEVEEVEDVEREEVLCDEVVAKGIRLP
jgi:hypothetical protein